MLMENYPNPASQATTIEFALPETMDIRLGIFNSQGIEVARAVDEKLSTGTHRITVNTTKLPTGNYMYRLSTPKGEVAKRMVIMR